MATITTRTCDCCTRKIEGQDDWTLGKGPTLALTINGVTVLDFCLPCRTNMAAQCMALINAAVDDPEFKLGNVKVPLCTGCGHVAHEANGCVGGLKQCRCVVGLDGRGQLPPKPEAPPARDIREGADFVDQCLQSTGAGLCRRDQGHKGPCRPAGFTS